MYLRFINGSTVKNLSGTEGFVKNYVARLQYNFNKSHAFICLSSKQKLKMRNDTLKVILHNSNNFQDFRISSFLN